MQDGRQIYIFRHLGIPCIYTQRILLRLCMAAIQDRDEITGLEASLLLVMMYIFPAIWLTIAPSAPIKS